MVSAFRSQVSGFRFPLSALNNCAHLCLNFAIFASFCGQEFFRSQVSGVTFQVSAFRFPLSALRFPLLGDIRGA